MGMAMCNTHTAPAVVSLARLNPALCKARSLQLAGIQAGCLKKAGMTSRCGRPVRKALTARAALGVCYTWNILMPQAMGRECLV